MQSDRVVLDILLIYFDRCSHSLLAVKSRPNNFLLPIENFGCQNGCMVLTCFANTRHDDTAIIEDNYQYSCNSRQYICPMYDGFWKGFQSYGYLTQQRSLEEWPSNPILFQWIIAIDVMQVMTRDKHSNRACKWMNCCSKCPLPWIFMNRIKPSGDIQILCCLIWSCVLKGAHCTLTSFLD